MSSLPSKPSDRSLCFGAIINDLMQVESQLVYFADAYKQADDDVLFDFDERLLFLSSVVRAVYFRLFSDFSDD